MHPFQHMAEVLLSERPAERIAKKKGGWKVGERRPRMEPAPVGAKYGMLTVLGEGERYYKDTSGKMSRRWRCKCECGVVRDVSMNNLVRGSTKSCGCMAGSTGRFTSETARALRARQIAKRNA